MQSVLDYSLRGMAQALYAMIPISIHLADLGGAIFTFHKIAT
jgi:hypothetical protein